MPRPYSTESTESPESSESSELLFDFSSRSDMMAIKQLPRGACPFGKLRASSERGKQILRVAEFTLSAAEGLLRMSAKRLGMTARKESEKGARKPMSDAKLISQRRLEANRRNALRSTGPKTPAGKSAVRWNAWKHGLHSRQLLLPGEKQSDWRDFREQLSAELKPVGELELLLADRLIALAWRIRRLGGLESDLFVWNYYETVASRNSHAYIWRDVPELQKLHGEEPGSEEESVSKVREARALQESESSTLGRAFISDSERADSFVKLSRYEGRLERSFYRALQELQRLQGARAGRPGRGGEGGSEPANTTRSRE